MRKTFLLLLLVTAIGTLSKAVDKVIANYDGISPKTEVATSPLILTPNAANPSGGGHVAQISKPAHADAYNLAYEVTFDSIKLQLFPLLTVSLYADTTAIIQPALIDSKGAEILIPYTSSKGITTGQENAWHQVTYDLSRYLKVLRYQGIKFYISKADSVTPVNIYFDDIKLSTLATSDSIVVTSETFGTADCRQYNAGGLNPPINYPVDTFTVRHNSSHPVGGPVVRGNDTWYPYTIYNDLPAGQLGYTMENGNWSDFPYPMFKGNPIAAGAGLSGTYPNETYSGSGTVVYINPTGYYGQFGWDTMEIDNIDIKGVKDLALGFALATRNVANAPRAFYIYYKVDGASTWTQFCDTTNYINFPKVLKVWSYVLTPKLTSVTGSTMSILFRGETTNPNNNRMAFDDVTLSGSIIPVTGLTIGGAGGRTSVSLGVPLQMEVTSVLPVDAFDQSVTWSVTNGTGAATIDPASGILTGTAEGTVTVGAIANDNSGITTSTVITIVPKITSIKVFTYGNVNTISTPGGGLQMRTQVLPTSAPDSAVVWSLNKVSGNATISSTGLVAALLNGDVYAIATGAYDASIKDSMKITISNQISVESVSIAVSSDVINTDNGLVTLTAKVHPDGVADTTITISLLGAVSPDTAILTITGINAATVTAVRNGVVTVRATSNADPSVYNDTDITITNQVIPVDSIRVTASSSTITTDKGNLQINATIYPVDATDKSVTWHVTLVGKADATINTSGLLSALKNGTVYAVAVSAGGLKDSMAITLTNQVIPPTSLTIANKLTGPFAIKTYKGKLYLKVNILPADATDKTVTWSVTDGASMATVATDGTVTATGAGEGDVIVKAVSNLVSSVSDTVLISISNQVGIGILSQKFSITNPVVNHRLLISNASLASKLIIYDLNGRTMKIYNNRIESSIDVSYLTSGLYIATISDGTNVTNVKFVIK